MNVFYFLNEDNSYTQCDVMTWGNQLECLRASGEKTIASDRLRGCHVSTVWLRIDHNFFGGEPLVFETMVFDSTDEDVWCKRYTSWKDAEEGHLEAMEWVKAYYQGTGS